MNYVTRVLQTIFEDLFSICHTQDSIDIDLINVLDAQTQNIKSLQQKDPYCKCICNTLHIQSVKSKFTIKNSILFNVVKEALFIPKALALAVLVNLYNIQGHSGTKICIP